MNHSAITDMLERGVLQPLDAVNIDDFLAGEGLRVLFFAGDHSRRSDAQDVAVALREVLKDYPEKVEAGLVQTADEGALQGRFRVLAFPSLALVLGGETLEVIPRVRDWSDYVQAFRRYLGDAAGRSTVENQA